MKKMVSEIPLQQCSRVLSPPEGIRQLFPLEGNIYKFYNPFERLTVFFLPSGDAFTDLSHYSTGPLVRNVSARKSGSNY